MDPLQERVIRLIQPLIAPDSSKRVDQAVKQFNAIVREYIRTETGLRLSDAQAKAAIPVKLVAGFPADLAELIDRYQDQLLWKLIVSQPKLGAAVEGLNLLLANWAEFEKWLELPLQVRGSGPALEKARDVSLALQQLTVAKKVLDELKAIHEDILGAYRYGNGIPPSVEIYWMAHALIAGALGVRVEDLTIVTLTHELAHGYTHLGKDIDGVSWKNEGFSKSALEVKEGLAQFYTAVVTEKLTERAPGVYPAYDRLLQLQTGPYRVHEGWLRGTPIQRAETIRFVMLQARNFGVVGEEQWNELLRETGQQLKRVGRQTNTGS